MSHRVTSDLAVVECRRAVERYRHRGDLTDEGTVMCLEVLAEMLDSFDVMEMNPQILRRASERLPTELATLDAIHLASALLYRDERGAAPALATHDAALARAARLMGLRVIGV